jgi:hypothetical protein
MQKLHHPAIEDIPSSGDDGSLENLQVYNRQVSQRLAERWAAGEHINPVVVFPHIQRHVDMQLVVSFRDQALRDPFFTGQAFSSTHYIQTIFPSLSIQQYVQVVLEHGERAGFSLLKYHAWLNSKNVQTEFQLFACKQPGNMAITAIRRFPIPDDIIRHTRGFFDVFTGRDIETCLDRYEKEPFYEHFQNFIRRASGKRDDEIHWPTVREAYERFFAARLETRLRRRYRPDDENPAKRRNVTTTEFGKPRISKRAFVNKYCKKRGCTTAYAIAKYNMCKKL